MKKIIMLDSTFDSNKKKLPRGEYFKVPEEVSAEDAKILVGNKMAKEVDKQDKKPAKPKAKKKQKK